MSGSYNFCMFYLFSPPMALGSNMTLSGCEWGIINRIFFIFQQPKHMGWSVLGNSDHWLGKLFKLKSGKTLNFVPIGNEHPPAPPPSAPPLTDLGLFEMGLPPLLMELGKFVSLSYLWECCVIRSQHLLINSLTITETWDSLAFFTLIWKASLSRI